MKSSKTHKLALLFMFLVFPAMIAYHCKWYFSGPVNEEIRMSFYGCIALIVLAWLLFMRDMYLYVTGRWQYPSREYMRELIRYN